MDGSSLRAEKQTFFTRDFCQSRLDGVIGDGDGKAAALPHGAQDEEIADRPRHTNPRSDGMCILPARRVLCTFLIGLDYWRTTFGLDCHHPWPLGADEADGLQFVVKGLPQVVPPCAPAVGRRVLDEALPVPDPPPDVQLVVEDAGAAGDVAPDRRVAPGPTEGPGHALSVELHRDRPGAPAGGVLVEDSAHNGGLGLIDPPRPGLPGNQIVPIADAAARHAVADPPLEPTVRLLGEVLEVQGVHRAP